MKRIVRQIEMVEDDMAGVLRQKTGAQRLRIASGMYASARGMLSAHLKSLHPDWPLPRVNSEVARRLSHGAC